MAISAKEHSPRILFWLGIVGIVFYALAPLVFPDTPLRQPELLPVYSSMIGLGQVLKSKTGGKKKSEDD